MSAVRETISRLPIRHKLTLLAAATGLLSFLLLGLTIAGVLRWSAAQSLPHQEAMLRPLLAAALTGPMIERNYAAVREIAADLVKSDAIDEITVFSAFGAKVAAERRQSRGPLGAEIGIDLLENGLAFGQVRLRLSAGPFPMLLERMAWAMLAAAILSMLLAFALFRVGSRHLTARLAHLATAAHALAGGHFEARAATGGGGDADEIGLLAHDFNHMADTVQATVQKLAASEGEVAAILQSIGDGLIATDTAMRVTYLNPVAEALSGWTEEEARGRGVAEIMKIEHALSGQPAEIPVGRVLETGIVVGLANHTVLVARDGRRYHIADSAAPIRDGTGQMVGVVMVFRDVSESYRLRADLDANRTRLALALKGANLGLWDRDMMTNTLVVDARWAGMLGYRPEELAAVADAWIALIHPDDLPAAKSAFGDLLEDRTPQYEAEFRMRAKSGSGAESSGAEQWRWILSRGRVTERDATGRPLRVTGTHLDITDRRAAHEEIERLAFFDPLTNLPNRRLLLDRLERELADARRSGQHGALLFVDLDHFKQINDARGHAAGDSLLREAALRLTRLLREVDTVARLGGDEFVVLLPDLADDAAQAATAARHVADKLRQALGQPYTPDVEGSPCRLGASIGVALFPDGEEMSCDAILRHADTAMYRAKQSGRNAVCFFEPSMQLAVEARLTLENDLRAALADEQFQIHLQAQQDAAGRVIGAEVLLRWTHPRRGAVPPSAFIPLAEETGLIDAIGDWVLLESARLQKRLESAGHDLRLSVNVSPRQFRQPDFVLRVRAILAQTGASPTRLTLEITESLLLSDHGEATARMHELQALGIRFSLDDFGTGYSSLSYLKRLPLQELKIDRSFVAGLPHDADDAALAETILLIARQMRLEVVAEGVETPAQLAWLKQNGCNFFQGYLLARPLPVDAFLALLAGRDSAA
ncbi:MAG: EAL domain-containing protein [Rhodocyclaceae bacterium]|nr:EAL domain-containing protein [Rhodocyclaceae bacterium]